MQSQVLVPTSLVHFSAGQSVDSIPQDPQSWITLDAHLGLYEWRNDQMVTIINDLGHYHHQQLMIHTE